MKFKILLSAILFITSSTAFCDVYVNGYHRSDGTYVQSHHRSDPDGDASNNWSTKGNRNPYTGAYGTNSSDNSYGTNPSRGANNGLNGLPADQSNNPFAKKR